MCVFTGNPNFHLSAELNDYTWNERCTRSPINAFFCSAYNTFTSLMRSFSDDDSKRILSDTESSALFLDRICSVVSMLLTWMRDRRVWGARFSSSPTTTEKKESGEILIKQIFHFLYAQLLRQVKKCGVKSAVHRMKVTELCLFDIVSPTIIEGHL